MITIEHQDEDLNFSFSRGGFCLVESCLYISIEGEAQGEDPYPPSLLFAVSGYPINIEEKKHEFRLESNGRYEQPYACFYTTFHSNHVIADVETRFRNDGQLSVVFSVLSDDVNYYNEKAKPNVTKGTVILNRLPIDELVIPS